MIVDIDKKECDTIAYVCALSGCSARFFTREDNPLMMRVEILDPHGKDLDNCSAWYIGRTVVWEMATREMKTL